MSELRIDLTDEDRRRMRELIDSESARLGMKPDEYLRSLVHEVVEALNDRPLSDLQADLVALRDRLRDGAS